jgi:hypothetical protein
MKIALICNSLLLSESLKIFLKPYITNIKSAHFIISDQKLDINKPVFLISNDSDAHLKKPFVMSSLISALENFYKENLILERHSYEDDKALQYEIEVLVRDFTDKLYKLIKEKQ